MKNFPIKVGDKEYWISRSCAVVAIVYKVDSDGIVYFIANKRGKGCPDYVGMWNIPCGYVDYDETIEGAVSRELFEETGVKIPENKFHIVNIDSNPNTLKQNIVIRFFAAYKKEYGNFSMENSEKDEVDDIRWISIKDVDNYEWAFNQRELIKELFHV